jgi:hypothetical protein
MTTGNAFSQSGAHTIHCGVENAYPLSRGGVWRWNSNYMKLDLGGYDQKITSIGNYEEKATQHGFMSATPAKVRFVGVGSFSFGGCFYDAAGLEWDPQNAARTLTLTNTTVQTTVGDLVAKSGVLRLSNGITFTRLGHISVGASGTFSAGAGAEIFATNVVLETGSKLVLESGRTIRCIHASFLNRINGRVHIAATAVEIRRVNVDNQRLAADLFREHTCRISQPVVAVDNIEIQTVSQHACYRFVVTDLLYQVVRIATREIYASEVVRTDTTIVVTDAVAQVIELLRTHLAFHTRLDVVVVHVLPYNRHTVCANDTEERLILVTPRLRNDERDIHVRLLCHAASQSVTRRTQTT